MGLVGPEMTPFYFYISNITLDTRRKILVIAGVAIAILIGLQTGVLRLDLGDYQL